MSRPASQPKVPGDTSQPEANQPEAVADDANAAAAEETVTVSKASLYALLARVAALESQPKAVAKRANPAADLPESESIDLATLKTPVLTKQGWLVPETYGSNPNAPRLA